MERAIKQRILGALVLAAGCAILVPVVLDGSGTLHQWREVPLPPRPSLPAPTTAQLPWTPPPAVAALPAPAPMMPSIAPLPVTTPATAAVVPLLHPPAPLQAMVSKTPPVRAVVVPKVAVLAPVTTPAPVQTDPVDMLPDMWTVQVASLTSEAAANSFKHQLEQAHQHVYTRHVGKAYKVYVGPELSRTQAEKTKQTLHAQGLQGWLQPYVVQ